MFDYLIVGAGIFGAVCARELTDAGKRVLVIDRRDHVAGNIYTEETEGIHVHRYGAHIFHTNDDPVWDYIRRFASFNRFTNCPLANYHGTLYNLPFNMHTFRQMWGVNSPSQAEEILTRQQKEISGTPKNLEEQAISLVGRDIYETLVKGYTEKQWGRDCRELPAFIIRRLPIRLVYDNNYFNARHQGIPETGYTDMIRQMLSGIEVRLQEDYLADRANWNSIARHIIFTGPVDAFFNYAFGTLEYRSLRFETELLPIANYQGNAVVNYTDRETPWTRIIEHKWFTFGKDGQGNDLPQTIITKEYSQAWTPGDEPFYPVNDRKNEVLYQKYLALTDKEANVSFGGRLGSYRYYDMDQVVSAALALCTRLREL